MKNDIKKQNSKKKGFLAMIWESMTKTGGCCGAGESCGSLPDKSEMENKDKKNEQSKKST